jgi:hypothetical protein
VLLLVVAIGVFQCFSFFYGLGLFAVPLSQKTPPPFPLGLLITKITDGAQKKQRRRRQRRLPRRAGRAALRLAGFLWAAAIGGWPGIIEGGLKVCVRDSNARRDTRDEPLLVLNRGCLVVLLCRTLDKTNARGLVWATSLTPSLPGHRT